MAFSMVVVMLECSDATSPSIKSQWWILIIPSHSVCAVGVPITSATESTLCEECDRTCWKFKKNYRTWSFMTPTVVYILKKTGFSRKTQVKRISRKQLANKGKFSTNLNGFAVKKNPQQNNPCSMRVITTPSSPIIEHFVPLLANWSCERNPDVTQQNTIPNYSYAEQQQQLHCTSFYVFLISMVRDIIYQADVSIFNQS